MREKVTPRVDIVFKKLFGVEEHKDLLMSLINAIVSEPDQVTEIELLNPYNPQNFRGDKLSILDIKARAHTGKYYNIELQIVNQLDYHKRGLYYWAKLYAEQLRPREPYTSLNKTIGIHILNFIILPSIEKYHNVFYMMEPESKVRYFEDIEMHTIELVKFEKSFASKNLGEVHELKLLLSKIKTALDRWIAFITRAELLNNERLQEKLDFKDKKLLKDLKLEKAMEILEVMNFNKQERDAYEGYLKGMRDEMGALELAHAEGIELGEQRGIEKGIEKGRAEGIEKNRLEIIANMLSYGIDVSIIAKSTGMPIDFIENFKLTNSPETLR